MKTPPFSRFATQIGFSGRKLNPTFALAAALVTGLFSSGSAVADSIAVPNGSFESPGTSYVTTTIDGWNKAAEPAYFSDITANYGIYWVQTAGIFLNTPVGQSDHIDNLDGQQSSYMLAFPGVSLSQELTSPNAKFEVGLSYDLTIGLLGKGMDDGNLFKLSLYYRGAGGTEETVASTVVAYSASSLPSGTHLTDFSVAIPQVAPTDAWAGKNIGVKLESVYGTGAGYWDFDKVRLTSVPEPGPLAVISSAGLVAFAALRHFRRKS